MRNFIVIIILILGINGYAQEGLKEATVFIRVYNLDGIKIGKGKIETVTDTTLHLIRRKKSYVIPANTIGSIKTKHSAGNNVLIGSAIGATAFGILLGSYDDLLNLSNSSSGEGVLAGIIVGAPVGAATGGITSLFKKSVEYKINGDLDKWKLFIEPIKSLNK